MASCNLLFFILVSFLIFATIEAQDIPVFIGSNCPNNDTTANSVFQLDLRTLFSSLSSKNTEFYNTKVIGKDPYSSGSIYGQFMCRGDIPSQLCHQCVLNATQRLLLNCFLSKEAVTWYDECMVRYSNQSFSSIIDRVPTFFMWNINSVSNLERFNRLLYATMNQTADEASIGGDKKFATREASVPGGLQKLYCLAQCTPDLSPITCRMCLSKVIGDISLFIKGKQGGRVLIPNCNIRYELFPFYRSISPSPAPAFVPQTNSFNSKLDSRFSQDLFYLSHNCTTRDYYYDDTYFLSIKDLLSYLLKTNNGERYHTADYGGLFGLFMCRGDISPPLCQQCVKEATRQIRSKCYSFQEAIIWYSHCMLRYSDHNFLSQVDTSPAYSELNVTSDSIAIAGQNSFTFTLSNQLTQLGDNTGNNIEKYMTKSFKLNDVQTLYTLAQCTQDLSGDACKSCLEDIITTSIPWSNLGSIGGRVLYPSCNLRFEMFKFYMDPDQTLPPNSQGSSSPPGHAEKQNNKPRIITLIVVPTIISMMLFYFGLYLLKRRGRMSRRTLLKKNFGHESATLEPLQFDLAVIKAATNNFSNDNYLGKGGFGEVYKGILFDGRHIAVKKLSRSSNQGVEEFKNEVILIAKLQHRNLVTFIGFCLEVQEKMLIYEFVPNKSLDYFLFDSKRKQLLSWVERYNIIRGIAGGILYLHEHSRLKVIHRDLKPSNILLDEHKIPKISDFGLARIVEISQDRGSTNRIVGTFGYMSPEYAMHGQFSEKSDVFSFGVMILEIVIGKKNLSSYEAHSDGLLNYAWRHWRDQTPLTILDPNIKDDDSKSEVIKCIQIGLLCIQHNPDARPTMMTVISYLNNDSIELPTPQEPAFCLHGRMDSKAVTNSSTISSKNEISISTFIPR